MDLTAIAESWVGTPFIPHASVRGVGVDCVHLVGDILREAGLVSDYKFHAYRCDAGMHQEESGVIEWLMLRQDFVRTDGSRIQAGDVLTFRVGRVAHHVGLAVGPARFIHATRASGTIISSLRDSTYAKRLDAVFRPYELSRIP